MRTRLISILIFSLFAVGGLVISPNAFAQESDSERAQQHFEDGAAFYTTGEYSKAIVEFLKGHAIAPNAMFLYNISLSYFKLDNISDALAAAEKARNEEGMPAKVTVRNEARIAGLYGVLSARDVAEDIAEPEPVAEEPAVARDPVEPVEEGSAMGGLGWTGVGLAAVGGGLVVGALIVNSGVSADIDALEAEADGGSEARFDSLKSDIEAGQSTGKILLYSGAGLASAGLIMLIIDLADGSESSSDVSVVPTDGGAQVGFGWSF